MVWFVKPMSLVSVESTLFLRGLAMFTKKNTKELRLSWAANAANPLPISQTKLRSSAASQLRNVIISRSMPLSLRITSRSPPLGLCNCMSSVRVQILPAENIEPAPAWLYSLFNSLIFSFPSSPSWIFEPLATGHFLGIKWSFSHSLASVFVDSLSWEAKNQKVATSASLWGEHHWLVHPNI
jgi:hypothetical protein